jgi:hypothetical protein
MGESLKIILPVFAGLLVVMVVIRFAIAWLRRRTREHIRRKFAGKLIVRDSIGANFFGRLSVGMGQIRGNGVLVLTPDELYFMMFVPRREVTIPLDRITSVSTPRSHLGKTVGIKLLRVDFASESGEDAVAWAVQRLGQWVADLERYRTHRR